jgi:hypothetical protein
LPKGRGIKKEEDDTNILALTPWAYDIAAQGFKSTIREAELQKGAEECERRLKTRFVLQYIGVVVMRKQTSLVLPPHPASLSILSRVGRL